MSGKLTPRQSLAVKHLAEGAGVLDVSDLCNISERQLYRWLKKPAFKAELNSLQLVAIEGISRRLVNLAEMALDTIEGIIREPAQPGASIKLRAAMSILGGLFRFRELADFETRLQNLEGRLL
jgi:hypothetical protein